MDNAFDFHYIWTVHLNLYMDNKIDIAFDFDTWTIPSILLSIFENQFWTFYQWTIGHSSKIKWGGML